MKKVLLQNFRYALLQEKLELLKYWLLKYWYSDDADFTILPM